MAADYDSPASLHCHLLALVRRQRRQRIITREPQSQRLGSIYFNATTSAHRPRERPPHAARGSGDVRPCARTSTVSATSAVATTRRPVDGRSCTAGPGPDRREAYDEKLLPPHLGAYARMKASTPSIRILSTAVLSNAPEESRSLLFSASRNVRAMKCSVARRGFVV